MKEVIQEAVNLLEKGEHCVLATVVRTRGSTPQKAGAKLLVRKDGSGVGTLGGGCVEGDIWFAAKEIMRFKGGPEFKDYFLNEEIAARDGLVCGGSMYFFLDPLWNDTDFLPFAKEALQAYDGGPVLGIATVVRSPNADLLGARFMLREDGSTQGSLGDPLVEELALAAIRQVSSLGKNDTVLTSDGTELFVEGFTTPPTLVIMGGGHIGKATSTLAATLGFRIYVVDDRPEFANAERFPEAAGAVIAPYSEGLAQVPINANTYIVVATRGHRQDDYALEAAIGTPATYVGLLGSKRKTLLIYKDLLEKGHDSAVLRSVRSPMGLDIGALTPEEIAVSIMSEIIMVRRGGQGGKMQMEDRYFNRAPATGKGASKDVPVASVGAVLLAAGQGRRMGGPKALLPWQDLHLVTYQIRTLRRAGLRPIAVVLGHRAAEISPHVDNEYGVSMLINPFYKRGKTTSLKTGLRRIDPSKTDSVLILNVDQPRTLDTLQKIIDHHHRHSPLITIPTYNRKRGHPVVVSLKLMYELMAVTEARQGLKAIIRAHAKEINEIEMETDEVLLDLNTPQDYQTALQNNP